MLLGRPLFDPDDANLAAGGQCGVDPTGGQRRDDPCGVAVREQYSAPRDEGRPRHHAIECFNHKTAAFVSNRVR